MPFPNEHAARLKSPGQFDEFRRTKGREAVLPGAGLVDVPSSMAIIWAKKEDDEEFQAQSLRFPIKSWTESEARDWLKDNKVKVLEFEPAEEEKSMSIKSLVEMPLEKFYEWSKDRPDHERAQGGTEILLAEDRVRVNKASGSTGIVHEFKQLSEKEISKLIKDANIPFRKELVSRTIPFWASDERVDRHGDIVRQKWDLTTYKSNPVIQFSHDWVGPPIGNSIQQEILERVDKIADYKGPALQMLNLFMDDEADPTGVSDSIFRMIKAGFLRSSSVGFYPKKVTRVEDADERAELGLGNWGVIFEENELIELSPTPIPANAGAVAILNHIRPDLKAGDLQAILEMSRIAIGRGKGDASAWRKEQGRWRAIWKRFFPSFEMEEHKDLDVPIEFRTVEHKEDITKVSLADVKASIDSLTTKVEEFTSSSIEKIASLTSQVEEIREGLDDLALDKEVERIQDDDETNNSMAAISECTLVELNNLTKSALGKK